MVLIGNYRDQFSQTPTPKTNKSQLSTLATAGDGNSLNDISNYRVTDIVGRGYADSTPIIVPPGSSSGAVVNTTAKVYEGIQPRHNNPSNPPELSTGTVRMQLTSGVVLSSGLAGILQPVIQFTPPEVQP